MRGPSELSQRRAAAVADFAPPITAVWHSATIEEPALHFEPECPALTYARESNVAVTEEAVAPGSSLHEVEATSELRLCGTCRSMFEADVKAGRAERRVAVSYGEHGGALVLFSDCVELRVDESERGTIPLAELQSVEAGSVLFFQTSTIRFVGSQGDLHFHCSSVAERDRILAAVKMIAAPDTAFD
jgi:hypothetical protein